MDTPTQSLLSWLRKVGRSRSVSGITAVMVGLTTMACGEQQPAAMAPVLSMNDFQFFVFRYKAHSIEPSPATFTATSNPTPSPVSTPTSSPTSTTSAPLNRNPSITWNDIRRAVELSFPPSDRPAVLDSLSAIVNPLNSSPEYAQAAVLVLGYRDQEAIDQLAYTASGDARDVLIQLESPEDYLPGVTIQEIVRRYRELQLPVPGHLEDKLNSPQPSNQGSGQMPVSTQARYQEALRNCTVGTLYLPEPTGLVPNSMIYMVILGREQDRCRVEYYIQAAVAAETPRKYLDCRYSPTTIETLVNNPNNTEYLNRVVTQECETSS
ncbi:hypothetical protein H6G89_14400 [Oscillatoria sp. FACHB-1407]|uniref:hypothetical protein n=1 Tax=Oscillatoria sp. FACHB-1407 TaxID=2692847 RepID=UPI001684934F|nr:hypothetical protein [Oscillatoria sp. FACHB-1407]MBD2462235.1 hypothetical protein [Oscillatoria sp. FACHB-1407]